MANEEKSKAEQYREERKERIAKTAKKNAKNMEKNSAAKKVAGRVVGIVLVVAIVICALGFTFNYYGVWQRVMPLGGVGSDQKVTVAEYEYYYMQSYNQLSSQSQYYQYYYQQDMGYDTTLSPEDQTKTTQDAQGNEITWVQYLHDGTISMAQMYKAYYNEALKEGLELDEADEASIQKTIDDYKDRAANGGASSADANSNTVKYSLNAYLRKLFGGSVNSRFLRKQLEIQTLAQKFYNTRSDKLAASYSQDAIDAEYNKDKDTYDMVDFRFYKFTNENLEAEDNETADELKTRQSESDANTKSAAESFYKGVTTESSFVSRANALNSDTANYNGDSSTKQASVLKADATSNYNSDVSTWLFDSSRKVGDKTLITDSNSGTYYVLLLTQGKHQTDTVDVRHILFKTVDDSNNPLSDDEIAKAKQNAADALKSWQDGEKTEDSFAALANELTEDTGSASNGGLYEDVLPGQMVTEFNNWCFDANRKPGDVEIVETDYGYHVMYFVSKNGAYYDSKIRTTKATSDIETEATELLDGDTYKVGFGPRRLNFAEKSALKKISNLVELSNNSRQSSAASSVS